MFRTFGPRVACATSRAARIVQIWNRRTFTVGSGPRTETRSHLPTRRRTDGLTIHGVKRDTRSNVNRTTQSSISTERPSLVCPSWIMCTMMALLGTMSLVITRSPSSVRTPMSCWITWRPPIVVSDCRIFSKTPLFHMSSHRWIQCLISTQFSLYIYCNFLQYLIKFKIFNRNFGAGVSMKYQFFIIKQSLLYCVFMQEGHYV